MKNSHLAPDGLARGVRIGRHAAAVLLILPGILGYIPFSLFLESPGAAGRFYMIQDILWSFVVLTAYFLLWRIASDAPTKKGALLLGVSELIPLLYGVLGLFCPNLFDSSPLVSVLRIVMAAILGLVFVYALSLLLRNGRLGASDRSWIGLLVVGRCIQIITSSFNLIWAGNLDLPWPHMWYASYYQIFSFGWSVLCIIACWRLTHCPLFAGRREDAEPLPAGFYSPLNRYMAAFVLASAAAVGALALLYANAAQIIG